MQVSTLNRPTGNPEYATQAFRYVLEDHLPALQTNAVRQLVDLSGRQLSKFAGDLFGLLIELGVKEEFHWITMRLNNYHSPEDFPRFADVPLKLVAEDVIKGLLDRYLSTSRQL